MSRPALSAYDLLRLLVRPAPDNESAELMRAGAVDEGEGGMQEVLSLAERHHVQSLVYRALKRGGAESQMVANLKSLALRNTQRNLKMTGELRAVLGAFARLDIAAIPVKGPTLAALAYGDLGLREFFDLDLLIERHDLKRAGDVLVRLGYRPQVDLALAGGAILDAYRVIEFTNEARDSVVELHWELSPAFLPFPAQFARLYDRTVEVELAGYRARTMSPEDLLNYLCVHGGKHWWEYLNWIADVAWLIRRRTDLDWRLVAERAREFGCERPLWLGLLLARELLETDKPCWPDWPNWMEELMRADAVAMKLSKQVYEWQASQSRPGTLEISRFYLALHPTLGGKLRCAYHLFIAPNVADWEFLRLPRPLAFLYPVVRIVRLVKERSLRR
ncbi:MAG: nucleotidyltransferase domain-containing protein [Blastocatellia bacterium]